MTPALRDQIMELARSGRTVRQIAAELGTSRAAVSRVTVAAGFVFERSAQVQAANAARLAGMGARRAEASEELLDALEVAQDALMASGSSRELRDAAIALEKIASAHAKLVVVGRIAVPDPAVGKSLVGDILGVLRRDYFQRNGETPDQPEVGP